MTRAWPATDVITDLRVAPDGVATAHTELYLEGARHHIHTTTVLIAADLIFSRLLHDDETLPGIDELQYRHLSNRNLVLTAADSSVWFPRAVAPAIRGRFRTARGRTLFLEGVASDRIVRQRYEPAGIFAEIMGRMHLEPTRGDTHRTTLAPLGYPWVACDDPILGRHAIVEFVLEGTRQLIRERFGDLEGDVLVAAGWKTFVWPQWPDVARGCVLEYQLSDGRLSSGAQLVHCDFAFASDGQRGRLTIARAPGARMAALEVDEATPAPSQPSRPLPE